MDLNEAVRAAMLEILGGGDRKDSPFYRKDEGPGASLSRYVFVGGDKEDRSPFYELTGDDKPIQRVLNLGDGSNPEDDVYTIAGKLAAIEQKKKKVAAKWGDHYALTIGLETSEGPLTIQAGIVTFTAMKLACLLAKGKADGTIAKGATIAIRLNRGDKNAKVIFPSLGIETPNGWKAVSLEGSVFDSSEFQGKTEDEREAIVKQLLPQLAL